MGVHLNDISLASWENKIPDAGGRDDESNLMIIVRESLKCSDRQTLDSLRGKIKEYVEKSAISGNLLRACQGLIGVKIQFKDGERYLQLSEVQSILRKAPKYKYSYALSCLSFPKMSFAGYQDYLKTCERSLEISLESVIEMYMTLENITHYRKIIEEFFLNTLNPNHLSLLYSHLKDDPYFKNKILRKIQNLPAEDYITVIMTLGTNRFEWINFSGINYEDSKKLAQIVHEHPSAIVDVPSHFLELIKNKKRLEINGRRGYVQEDFLKIKKNNPDITELILINCSIDLEKTRLVSSSIISLTFIECTLSVRDLVYLKETLVKTDLTIRRTYIEQYFMEELYPKLASLTLELSYFFKLFRPLPVRKLHLMGRIAVSPQPYVRYLTLDPQSYSRDYADMLPNFPNIHTFAFSTRYQSNFFVDQEFIINIHRGASQIKKLILSSLNWGSFPHLRIRFHELKTLDISRTAFFESNPESILSKFSFMCPKLRNILFDKEDIFHYAEKLEVLKTRFPSLKFIEKKSG